MNSFAPEQVKGLTGRPEGVEPLFAALQGHPGKLHHQYFAALQTEPNTVAYAGTPRPATPADLDQTAAIYGDAAEMSRSREAVATMPNLWVVEAAGEVRCVGAIHAETPHAGMIGAAGRIYHRLGYADLGPFAMVHFGM